MRFNERIKKAKESIGKHDIKKVKSTKLKPEFRTTDKDEEES